MQGLGLRSQDLQVGKAQKALPENLSISAADIKERFCAVHIGKTKSNGTLAAILLLEHVY